MKNKCEAIYLGEDCEAMLVLGKCSERHARRLMNALVMETIGDSDCKVKADESIRHCPKVVEYIPDPNSPDNYIMFEGQHNYAYGENAYPIQALEIIRITEGWYYSV